MRYIRYRLAVRIKVQGGISTTVPNNAGEEDDRLFQLSKKGKISSTASQPTTLINTDKKSSTLSSASINKKGKNEEKEKEEEGGGKERTKETERLKERREEKETEKVKIKVKVEDIKETVIYNSEVEMISALSTASTDPLYSDTYQRCCKVLIKIAYLSQAKHFFWEVDSIMYPDYYSSINKPIMIANVTSNLINKSYGTNNMIISELFYQDMRQIVLNCFAYNTEITAVYAQAQKLYQVCALFKIKKLIF